MTGVAREDGWIPSEAEISSYKQNGWVISPCIVSDELLDRAWNGIQHFLDAPSSQIAGAARVSDVLTSAGGAMDHVGYLFLEVPEVRELIRFTPIARAAAHLAGTNQIRLFHDRLIAKPPKSRSVTTVGWHVDRAYWYSCTSDEMLTAWIPFDDIETSMGPLMVFSGSHRRDAPLLATAHRQDMEELRFEAGITSADRPEALLLKKGQVSFHHCRIVHGSLPNLSERPRRALSMHLQPGDNRHRQVILPDDRLLGHANDLLCRTDVLGMPDYTDPAVFPVLWERLN